MRRKELEITDRAAVDALLERALAIRIGMSVDDRPYVVPVAFGYDGACIYFHSAPEGKKIDMLRANPRVCFETDLDHELVAREGSCAWGMKYNSVIGFGAASFIEDTAEKKRALEIIMRHYGGENAPIDPRSAAALAVVRIEIDILTGKTRYGK